MSKIRNFLIEALGGYTTQEVAGLPNQCAKYTYEDYEIVTITTEQPERLVNILPMEIALRSAISDMIPEIVKHIKGTTDRENGTYITKLMILDKKRKVKKDGN